MNTQCLIVYFLIVFNSIAFAQNNTITIRGSVTDSLQKPLANATLIARPIQESVKTKYAISNTNGAYTLQLLKETRYELSISHLGFKPLKKELFFFENNSNYNIQLNTKSEGLGEVVINYKYEPLKKNKDTITYSLGSFTNGNEFKMKDVLNKLPGVKIENNVIKVQGKTITKLLVEGKSFFDGNTKLAIENIPAEVMDKIEIISNYKESELLRNLADNEDLALNVVLKEDKKDFAFGDIEAGIGLNEFYSLHSTLFKYNPKSNISFIGDINNFNKSSLDFSELSRLVGGSSNLLKRNRLSSNLLNFASNNTERYKSTTRFSALNFQYDFNDKLNLSGYTIYSNNDIINKSLSIREYLSDDSFFETRNDTKDSNDDSTILNLKLDYNPNAAQKWVYNINYLRNASGYLKQSLSSIENTSQFFTTVNGKNDTFSHNLDGYFRMNGKHTLGVALHHSVVNSNSIDNWFSNTIFLEDFIPLTQATSYQIQQSSVFKSQKFNFILKDYWLTSRYYHLFYNIGFNYKNSKIKNNISQVLPNDISIYFPELINNNPLKLSDVNFGLGIKSQLGKFEFVLEAKPHYFKFNRSQIKDNDFFIEPKFNISYKINDDKSLDFDYIYTNRYLINLSYIENIKIIGFNSIIQGNPNLKDERSHNFSLYYNDYENIDDYFLDASIDYSISNPVKNNSIIQNGINQLSLPVILNIPEKNLSFNTELGLIFRKSSLDFGIDLDWLKINQVINEDINTINSFEYSLSGKWLYKLSKKTQLNLKYDYSGYQVNSNENSLFTENIFSLNFDTKFLKNVIFKTDFSTHFVNDFNDNTQNYTLQNLYLGYYKPNCKFSYSLNFRNIYNNGTTIKNSFSNNLLISNKVFTLPRVILFEFKYKF